MISKKTFYEIKKIKIHPQVNPHEQKKRKKTVKIMCNDNGKFACRELEEIRDKKLNKRIILL